MADAETDQPPGRGIGDLVPAVIARVDSFQRRHGWAGFPYAVIKKYGDDAGGKKAALITYYGFLSIFPILLLVVVTVTRVLAGNPELRDRAINSIVPAQFQDTVTNAVTTLPTGAVPYTIGIIGLLFSASGAVFSVYDTLNHLAAVPHRDRFGTLPRYLRGFAMLAVLLVGILSIGALAIVTAAIPDVAGLSRALSVVGVVLIAFGLLVAAPKLLVARSTTLGDLWPAAAGGTIAVSALFLVFGPLLARFVTRSGPVYGAFATIIGLFALLYLVSQVLLYAAEIAVVRKARLWPRALDTKDPTIADVRALTLLALIEQRLDSERISVEFDLPDRVRTGT